MILAGNVGSQGGIQNGYMYAILFGAVSAVRSSLLKTDSFSFSHQRQHCEKKTLFNVRMLDVAILDVRCHMLELRTYDRQALST
jgi:hypothetical protein